LQLDGRRSAETVSAEDFGGNSWDTTVGSFLGYPVVEDANLGALTAGSVSGYFVDPSQALIMRTVSAEVLTLIETFADTGMVGYTGWFRAQVVAVNAPAAAAQIVQHS
jgi:HK97 family phage major capsid protein